MLRRLTGQPSGLNWIFIWSVQKRWSAMFEFSSSLCSFSTCANTRSVTAEPTVKWGERYKLYIYIYYIRERHRSPSSVTSALLSHTLRRSSSTASTSSSTASSSTPQDFSSAPPLPWHCVRGTRNPETGSSIIH